MNRKFTSEFEFKDNHTILADHFNKPDSYMTSRPDGMNSWLMTYTIDGEGYFHTPSGNCVSRSGDLTILKPLTPHQYGTVAGGSWDFVWVHFSHLAIEASLIPEAALYQQSIHTTSVRKRIYRCFKNIWLDSRERNPYWQELCTTNIREILILLLQRSSPKYDPRIEEIRSYLSQRLREPIRIESLARAVGLSPSRMSHLFKEHTGQSIIDTLNQMRIQQAALLLVHTDRSASEVSHDVGFNNYNHFINQFHKVFHVSPSAYRKEKMKQLKE